MTSDVVEQRKASTELAKLLGTRYKVRRHLGTGGAGIAFLVTEQSANVHRVAKLLRREVRHHEQIRADFQSEAKKLAGLRHRNLVTVYEQSKSDQTPFFVMEFVDGTPLDVSIKSLAKTKRAGQWILDLRAVFLQVADVIAYLHAQEPRPLLHLDIKPENVLLVTIVARRGQFCSISVSRDL